MRRKSRQKKRLPLAKASGGMPPNTSAKTGLLRHLAALLYDGLLLASIYFVLTAILIAFRGGEAFSPAHPGYSLCLIVTGLGFFGWFWTHGGQTLGMRAWGLQVQSLNGTSCHWQQALLRGIWALLGGSFLGLGYLWSLIDHEGRTLQDHRSGTRLIRVTPHR
ncbi:MAG: RDD family protein [Gammaproteobacteria bacterium]|nr:RDD family protein [Gammaproteobacteria bacterium]NDE35072.1 RDD family protein [Gammaproteobacteria bacterium]NDE56846.1 RDD family protein [Gammaproteobacteria bacterium]NDG86578.1 RDD family protein [Gammaproteobacteria bacterium]